MTTLCDHHQSTKPVFPIIYIKTTWRCVCVCVVGWGGWGGKKGDRDNHIHRQFIMLFYRTVARSSILSVIIWWLWNTSPSTSSHTLTAPSLKNHTANVPKDSDVGLKDGYNHITVKASILDDVANSFLKPFHISKHLKPNRPKLEMICIYKL